MTRLGAGSLVDGAMDDGLGALLSRLEKHPPGEPQEPNERSPEPRDEIPKKFGSNKAGMNTVCGHLSSIEKFGELTRE